MGKKLGMGCLILIGGFVALGVLGAIVGGDSQTTEGQVASSTQKADAVQSGVAAEEPADTLTGPQRNAARSAKQYLDMTGFSREGLIDQLSSDAGNGYEVADATVAVDSLNVDWNEQAVRSAKQYLDMSGFSCKGLIDQLSSSAGSQYTESEATYGAKQAGAC
ncbi:Ltp family lipoprotein [Novosphingobium sp. HII-3]|uniref:Ltp family lipoprotein n=1 Tax=Novosphingobium sp. HII-3 TaxID=2075565 RepID=UPI0018EAEF16|nr:Ltp family lipoprotein [Novosphingobium sp. HII-3]